MSTDLASPAPSASSASSAPPGPPGLSAVERLVVGAVGVTGRAVATVAPDLTLLQWRVLVVLAGVPEGLTVSALAGHLGSRLPATSRLLGRLQARSLVERGRHAFDGRATLVRLAPAGQATWERVRDRRHDELQRALAAVDLAPGDASVLERVADALWAFA